jgi:hypothetical protein
VLATRVHTDTLAGLPGMLLSQVEPGADVGKPGGAAVTASVYGEHTPCIAVVVASAYHTCLVSVVDDVPNVAGNVNNNTAAAAAAGHILV